MAHLQNTVLNTIGICNALINIIVDKSELTEQKEALSPFKSALTNLFRAVEATICKSLLGIEDSIYAKQLAELHLILESTLLRLKESLDEENFIARLEVLKSILIIYAEVQKEITAFIESELQIDRLKSLESELSSWLKPTLCDVS